MLFTFLSNILYAQEGGLKHEFGLTVGGFTNFPVNKNYLKENIKVISIAPYVRLNKHELYVGFLYPLKSPGLFSGSKITPSLSAIGGYKFYIFNNAGRENLFLNYSFQYLKYLGYYEKKDPITNKPIFLEETPSYINNVIGFGYVVYFDQQHRFGFYYTLGYVISQLTYVSDYWQYNSDKIWQTQYIWNHASTNIGFSFKF